MAAKDSRVLENHIRGLGSVLVAYSGGVDSGVLAQASYNALHGGALAVTFDTPTIPRRELSAAKAAAKRMGIRHIVVKYTELSDGRFAKNPKNRCFFCKRAMACKMKEVAKRHGMRHVIEGTNAQDLLGHRPGYRAIKGAGIGSPLAELGFTKEDVRAMARKYGLDWRKPSAACLASRIPTGVRVTKARLRKIEESEDYLKSLGLTQVRVRLEGAKSDVARIVVESNEFYKVAANRNKILRRLPFKRVTLDLRGYS
jgi:pyridinium-3,5-biscarboxylic acid mononucleotide sulfurtransferase